MTGIAIGLLALAALLGVTVAYLVRRSLNYADDMIGALRVQHGAEAARDVAVRARDVALADAVAEEERAETALAGEAAQKQRADKAEAIVRTHVEKQLDSADPADVARIVGELLATDLRDPADAARPAADRGGSAGAAEVRGAAGAGSGGG
jgi:hypothetical protein